MFRQTTIALLLLITASLHAADWPQFRGPGGLGVAADKTLPTTWSDDAHIAWKTDLPGPGSSSPIVNGDRIFVTCYSGYGLKQDEPGDLKNLKRHLVCLDRAGKVLWERTVATEAKDYAYESFQVLHGYASSTPASDGKNVYCFFGVAGVVAFDLVGKQLWQTSVGTGTSDWGSGTSPVLAGDLVIVNASVESGSIVALNKSDGKIAWTAKGVSYSWTTPLLIKVKGRDELIVSVYQKLRAFEPTSGKELWSCEGLNDYVCPSLTTAGDVVFAIGARSNTAIAVRAGGSGDVTATNLLWTAKRGSNVSSPIHHDGHLYWAHEGRGVVYCADAKTGKIVYEERLNPESDRIYASAFLAGGKIYYVSRNHGAYIVDAKPEFKLLAHNTIKSDTSVFNASPAAMDGKLLLRSDRRLYCIGQP